MTIDGAHKQSIRKRGSAVVRQWQWQQRWLRCSCFAACRPLHLARSLAYRVGLTTATTTFYLGSLLPLPPDRPTDWLGDRSIDWSRV